MTFGLPLDRRSADALCAAERSLKHARRVEQRAAVAEVLHVDAMGALRIQASRDVERKGMAPLTDSSVAQILTILIGSHLSDRGAVVQDPQHHCFTWRGSILRP